MKHKKIAVTIKSLKQWREITKKFKKDWTVTYSYAIQDVEGDKLCVRLSKWRGMPDSGYAGYKYYASKGFDIISFAMAIKKASELDKT